MGFLKSVRRSNYRLPKKEPKGYAWPKGSSPLNRKSKKKRDKTKYTGAVTSRYEKNDNIRIYSFDDPFDSPFNDDSTTTCTTDSGGSSSETGGEMINRHYSASDFSTFETCDSSEGSQVSNMTTSSCASTSSENIVNTMEIRDDMTGNVSVTGGNRDHPEIKLGSNINESAEQPVQISQKQTSLEKLKRDEIIDFSQSNSERSLSSSETLDTSKQSTTSSTTTSSNSDESRKSKTRKEMRRTASETSRDYVHVFHQPLPPLEEDSILYDNVDIDDVGMDADDELTYSDDSDSESTPEKEIQQRRGSMNSFEDETDIRKRWEYGLAVMAEMGLISKSSDGIKKSDDTRKTTNILKENSNGIKALANNAEFDEETTEEI